MTGLTPKKNADNEYVLTFLYVISEDSLNFLLKGMNYHVAPQVTS